MPHDHEGFRDELPPPRDGQQGIPNGVRDREPAPGARATSPREGPHRHGPAQHPHSRTHSHSHGQGPGHIHSHHPEPDQAYGPGHNHGPGEPLHSHLPHADEAADLQILTAQFIDGFREARDKAAYLRIAGVPLEIPGDGPALKLVDVRLTTRWQVGTASPSFGSTELSYLPFPGPMIEERTDMALVYVSLREKRLVDLREFLRARDG